MNLLEPRPSTRPESSAGVPGPRPEGLRGSPGGAVHFLFTRGTRTRSESRRVAAGLAVLGLVSAVLLNFAAIQNANQRMVEERWQRLAQHTEASRDQVRAIFTDFEQRIRYLAGDERFNAWVRAAMQGSPAPADQQALTAELERAARVFDLRQVLVLSPEGVPLAGTSQHDPSSPVGDRDLVRRAARTPGHWVADLHADASGHRVFEIAFPVAAAALEGRIPLLVAATDAEAPLAALQGGWNDVGPTAFGYLVRPEGQEIHYLTSPDHLRNDVPAQTAAMTLPESRPAAMAATGIEANIEQADTGREPYCATTRFLPELGWGLVGRIDRKVVMAGMRDTLQRLLVLDLALLGAVFLLLWQFRRTYTRGLARAERRVTRRHAERVQAIFDSAFDAIVTYDGAGRVHTINRAAEELLGRPAEEVEGEPLHRFLRWSGGSAEEREHELPTPGIVRIANALRPDGSTVPTEMSLGQSGDGDELLYNAILRDIGERVEAERRIRAFAEGLETSNRRLEEVNAQLEGASQLKSEFLANTSHELRTPLNGIMGFLQLVLDGMCETREEEQEFLRQALQCSRHLLGLINDVLDIARIEAGKLTLDIQRVEIGTLFNEVRTLTHVQAAQKSIQLQYEEPEDAGQAVRCDFGKAKQILINLVGNSLKFTNRGAITVRAIPRPNLGHVMFEVTDTGIGIPKEQQAVIFEKFAQGDGSTTRRYGGAGLGLAISRSLVELMGGVIGVRSEGRGKGTTMYFSLPAWSEQVAETAPADESTPDQIGGPAGGPLVLIVEDDPVFRKFMIAVLHSRGYRTLGVDSAEAAWVRVRRLKPAVVVLDYALSCREGAGLRTGWDLAERMTTDPETRHVPVLFVTGFESEVLGKLSHTAFARKPEHLMKPIEPQALVNKMEEMIAALGDRQVRVLVAEDDPGVTAFVRKVLPEARFHIEVASNGEECLHILRTQPNGFDLLLLDLMMPEVSGYDVLRDMALTGTGAQIPVLVFTNWPEPRNAEEKRLLEQGVVLDVLSKTSVHDNPQLLAHLIDWHLQAAGEEGDSHSPRAEAA